MEENDEINENRIKFIENVLPTVTLTEFSEQIFKVFGDNGRMGLEKPTRVDSVRQFPIDP